MDLGADHNHGVHLQDSLGHDLAQRLAVASHRHHAAAGATPHADLDQTLARGERARLEPPDREVHAWNEVRQTRDLSRRDAGDTIAAVLLTDLPHAPADLVVRDQEAAQ